MTSRDEDPGLFYLAAVLVAFVVVMIVARRFLRSGRRLHPMLALALAGATHQPAMPIRTPWHSEGLAGWSSPYMPHPDGPARHRLQVA